jgi:hypothetical protein
MDITVVQDRHDATGECHTEELTYTNITGLAITWAYRVISFTDSSGIYHIFGIENTKEIKRQI